VLHVETKSGTITVDLPLEGIPPPRDYITNVQTISGTIHGKYYLGPKTVFQTKSATIDIDVLPVFIGDDGESAREFWTETISGTTNIKVVEPIFFPKANGKEQQVPETYIPIGVSNPYLIIPRTAKTSLRSLRSSHIVKSASLDVQYPEAWEGNIYAESISGSVDLRGNGVEIIRQEGGWGRKKVVARRGVKGNEGSRVDLESISGSIKLMAA